MTLLSKPIEDSIHQVNVSVVVPTLNEAGFIGNCIRSIRNAVSAARVEIIVVDNGSRDDTVEIAWREGAIAIVVTGATIAKQRNVGAARAEGELIAFVDADCTVSPGWLQAGIQQFRDTNVVSAGASPDPPPDADSWVEQAWCFLKRQPNEQARRVPWIASCNLWVRKSTFQQCGGFDESLETCEDSDLGYRLGDLGDVVSDPAMAIVHHREPKTLKQLYRKEIWHGKNSFDGVLRGRFTPSELPSLITPILFGGSVIVLVIGFLVALLSDYDAIGSGLMVAGVCGLLMAPSLYTIRAVSTKGNWNRIHHYFMVYLVYFTARTDAMVRWIVRYLRSRRPKPSADRGKLN
ncbi:MAG TPA: hypothetical protein DDZ51_02090 [Planctomycetaceae bacterium]|nr:hypothetical protein [Planctomycetaceae bacterium]